MTWLEDRWEEWRASRAFAGLGGRCWLIESSHFANLLDQLAAPYAARMKSSEDAADPESRRPKLETDGTYRIPVRGVLMHDVPWVVDRLGIEATSTRKLKQTIEAAKSNPSIKSVHFDVDSGGGEVAGMFELAESIKSLRSSKRVTAHTDNVAASAAYLIASQADRFTAAPGALVGSIGVLAVMEDLSAAAHQKGYKPHVIRSGRYKGVGVPGTEITAEQREDEQRIVDGFATRFVDAVADGRRVARDRIAPVADGRMFHTDEAISAGLLDAVENSSSHPIHPPMEHGARAAAGSEPPVVSASTEGSLNSVVQEEETVSVELKAELERLKLENEKLTKEAEKKALELEASRAAHRAAEEGQKQTIIDRGIQEGRITPAMRGAVDKYAAVATPEELTTFVASLQVQTRSGTIGQVASNANATAEDDQLRLIAKKLGVTPEQIKASAIQKAISVRTLFPKVQSISKEGGN